jgi:hypothetical protein
LNNNNITAEKREEYQRKLDAIATILAAREADDEAARQA